MRNSKEKSLKLLKSEPYNANTHKMINDTGVRIWQNWWYLTAKLRMDSLFVRVSSYSKLKFHSRLALNLNFYLETFSKKIKPVLINVYIYFNCMYWKYMWSLKELLVKDELFCSKSFFNNFIFMAFDRRSSNSFLKNPYFFNEKIW